jgi:hypothetical protein
MYTAFVNFNGVLIDSLKKEELNENDFMIDYSKTEFFQLKIYELYFSKNITTHFERIFKFLIKKEEMYLSYIKFKNMYVIDLSSDHIIFDMLALRKSEKNQKLYKNEKIWQEILHHSKNLMEVYMKDNGRFYENKDALYRVNI